MGLLGPPPPKRRKPAKRLPRNRRGFDAEYDRRRAALLKSPEPCQLRIAGVCTHRATSLDHRPPISLHTHVPGSGCCRLVPSCLACNLKTGRWRTVNAKLGRRVAPLRTIRPAPPRSKLLG